MICPRFGPFLGEKTYTHLFGIFLIVFSSAIQYRYCSFNKLYDKDSWETNALSSSSNTFSVLIQHWLGLRCHKELPSSMHTKTVNHEPTYPEQECRQKMSIRFFLLLHFSQNYFYIIQFSRVFLLFDVLNVQPHTLHVPWLRPPMQWIKNVYFKFRGRQSRITLNLRRPGSPRYPLLATYLVQEMSENGRGSFEQYEWKFFWNPPTPLKILGASLGLYISFICPQIVFDSHVYDGRCCVTLTMRNNGVLLFGWN